MRITEYCLPHKPGNHDASEAYPLVDAERERKKMRMIEIGDKEKGK